MALNRGGGVYQGLFSMIQTLRKNILRNFEIIPHKIPLKLKYVGNITNLYNILRKVGNYHTDD